MDFDKIIEHLSKIFNGKGTPLDYISLTAIVAFIFFKYILPTFKSGKDYREKSNCETHQQEIESSKSKFDTIQGSIINIENKLAYIAGSLGHKSTDDNMSVTRSPRQVSDKGFLFLTASGADILLENIKSDLIVELQSKNPKTALDVETISLDVLINHSNDDSFNHLKNHLYNNPKFQETDVNLSSACFLMSLELRNEYLKLHPEIIPDIEEEKK